MAAVARGYFVICLYKLFVGYSYLRICLSTDGWEDSVASASAVTPFSAENNVYQVYLALFCVDPE